MKVLTFGMLYPDATRPQHGVFVEHRLRQLVALGGVDAMVVAPVPWFPSGSTAFGAWGEFARVPHREVRYGIAVERPRFLSVPRVGMTVAPALLALGARGALRRALAGGFDFDLIDAQYFYPDGVAAVMLGRWFDKPVTITARGSDLNVIARYRLPRRMIRAAAGRAAGVITVSAALKKTLRELGAPAGAIEVLRNGVDLDLFRPSADRRALRERLGLRRPTLLSVGNLVPLKGHDLVIGALRSLPEFDLVIAGAGPEDRALRALAETLGVAGRVRFVGRLDQAELGLWYAAADALVLASASEGWPNVLLEAMACGTPVAATNVGGTPELVCSPDAGTLIMERTPAGVASGVQRLVGALPDRAATRRYAETFSWKETAVRLKALFERVIREGRAG
jgi:glycosyltransferase involved in cell wall biosynthesis